MYKSALFNYLCVTFTSEADINKIIIGDHNKSSDFIQYKRLYRLLHK